MNRSDLSSSAPRSRASLYWTLGGVAVVVLSWELAALFVNNFALLPHLPQIFGALTSWARSGLLLDDLMDSLPRTLIAIFASALTGVGVGLALALVPSARFALEWYVHFLRSLPPVALLPVFILWFGIDWWSKLAATIFVCIFPVAVTTAQAAIYADRQYAELARDLQLRLSLYVTRVILPAALPAITPGIRLSSSTAFIMLYVSELAGASRGLGYRISISQLAFQADMMFAGLLTLGGIAWLADRLIERTSKRILHYAGK